MANGRERAPATAVVTQARCRHSTRPPVARSIVPDVTDRAASLVSWIARDLDTSIRTPLHAGRSGRRDSRCGRSRPPRARPDSRRSLGAWLAYRGPHGPRPEGDSLRRRLGRLGRLHSPWRDHHREWHTAVDRQPVAGARAEPSVDVAQRRTFYESIETAIAAALRDGSFYRRV